MNREIKFRGITTYGNKWVYGYLVCYGVEHGIVDFCGNYHIIDGNTAGQFTSLEDKHGKELWEKDIVEGKDKYGKKFMGIIKRGEYVFYSKGRECQSRHVGFYLVDKCGRPLIDSMCDSIGMFEELVKVGNIFENKELLETVKDE